MADFSLMKLGRKAIKTDSRTLRLARYLTPELPPPPTEVRWSGGVSKWGMMMNDSLGDCTIAGVGHALQVWTRNLGSMMTVPDFIIERYYSLWDGYIPGNPSTDNGGIELDVLTNWRKTGFDSKKLIGFADPNVSNLTEIHQAIYLFGGVYIGINLPLTAQNQTVWDVVPDDGSGSSTPGSWGGHCVFVPDYRPGFRTCITWGGLMDMTDAFWNLYVDESHALLGEDWIGAKGTPLGFNLAAMQNDLSLIY